MNKQSTPIQEDIDRIWSLINEYAYWNERLHNFVIPNEYWLWNNIEWGVHNGSETYKATAGGTIDAFVECDCKTSMDIDSIIKWFGENYYLIPTDDNSTFILNPCYVLDDLKESYKELNNLK